MVSRIRQSTDLDLALLPSSSGPIEFFYASLGRERKRSRVSLGCEPVMRKIGERAGTLVGWHAEPAVNFY